MNDSPFKFKTTCDKLVGKDCRCTYCGSMSVERAIELLKTPNTNFSGTDWKYGWPHKFYINNEKFYSEHLLDAEEKTLEEFNVLSESVFNIYWKVEGTKLHYKCPSSNSMYGFQMFGVINEDGKPDHSRMQHV